MPRDYKKESVWAAGRYRPLSVRLLPELADRLEAITAHRTIKKSDWVAEKINEEYLKLFPGTP